MGENLTPFLGKFNGLMHYAALPRMKHGRFDSLMVKFGELLRAQRLFREVFGLT